MSPRKFRRRNLMDHSVTSTNTRSKVMITSDKKTSLHDKELNRKTDQINIFHLNDSQQKHEQTRSTQLLQEKKYLEKSKKCYTFRKSTLAQKNLKLKENEDVMHDNTLVDIDNVSYELIKESPIQFIDASTCWSKMEQFNTTANLDISKKEESVNNNSLNGIITPKCSPISVTLTPLRTTKTPKRSPVNLASPKVPPEVPFRLSKTPRKLQLFSSSPTISSSLDTSLRNQKHISNNVYNTTLENISVNDVNAKSNKLRKSRKSTEKLKLIRRRSSKSPKIVLRLPSSKSEFKTSKIKLDNQKDRNISVRKLSCLKNSISQKVSAFSNKNNNDKKLLLSEETQLDLTLTNVNNLSEKYKEIILKKPIVLLERIPLLDSLSVSLKNQSNQRLMGITLNVAKYVQKQLFKDLSSLNHSISHINHKYPKTTEESPSLKSFNNKKNIELNDTNCVVSSTPKSTRNSNSSFTPISFTNERVRQNVLMEDDDVRNSTYEVIDTNDNRNNTKIIENRETTIADETYDISEPKTPHLRRHNRENASVEVDNNKKENRKVFKVRFTTPERQIEKLQSKNNIEIRKTPRIKYISRRRSHSLSNTSTDKSTPKLVLKRRSISTSSINVTPFKSSNKKEKRLSSMLVQKKSYAENEEKKDIKRQIVKTKIPNFVEIHKKMFAKMESIIDNKERLIQQHEALKTPKIVKLDKNNMKKFKSIETKKNESYNRYGFRMKKADATNIILRKQQANIQNEKREENKAFLKGVRTNRRFELLMKMRKVSD